ncbi:hypothetical protein OOT00_03075 [Desulfobotulus sp. H1]|uniref:Tetratricopeptide repeat protein n=1 Tax=Desulfobotulus pelophilus TaxID=2823377 RepID=A0ABT3N681_9BACT|nr:hypothetical protein [Desulfobotulus pelophilus]MCW7752963.1 hypothetical protein [Desulfobotulus pelophilus]
MKRFFWFFWGVCFLVLSNVHAEEQSGCRERALFDYGISRYGAGLWDLAASGLDRFLFFCPEDEKRDAAAIFIARCLSQQGHHGESADLLRRVHREGGAEASLAGLLLASLYAETGEAGQAVLWAENVVRTTADSGERITGLWIAGGQYLKAGDPHGAAARWDLLPEEERRQAENLWVAWQDKPEDGKKNPVLAGILGVVPGGGYFYTGRKQAGTMAFGLTIGMGAAAWEAFDQDLPVLGTFLALVTLGFYGGSMKGGMEEARMMNRNMDAAHEEAVLAGNRKEEVFSLGGGSIRISLPF